MTKVDGIKEKIIIVDDEKRNLKILNEMLEDFAELKMAETGEQALKEAETFNPQLALLDIMMPGMNGYEVCKRLKVMYPKMKVIMLTGKTQVEEKVQGYEAGADDYVTKPFMPDELIAKVKVFIKLYNSDQMLTEMNKDLEEKIRVRTEQLLKTQKLSFLGMHTAEIVHNMKSPLTVLKVVEEHFLENLPDDKMSHTLKRAIEKLEAIVKSILMGAGRSRESEATEIFLSDVIENELKLLESNPFFKHDVTLVKKIDRVPPISGVYTHFGDLFGNLLKNSVEAMFGKDKREMFVSCTSDATNVTIIIEDTGCGIPQAHLDKLFDPFFTTKPATSKNGEPTGTGLGLSSVKRMIESYHGTINFESRDGSGTKVIVNIPAAQVCYMDEKPTDEKIAEDKIEEKKVA